LDAMDRIKDTASSHEQAFLIEFMGKTGHLTLMAAMAGGAEVLCLPEVPFTLAQVAADVANAYVRGKRHCLVAVAAGARPPAAEIARYLEARRQETGFAVRLTLLGHIQRGGAPTAADRLLATRLGAEAVDLLHAGRAGLMVGVVNGELRTTPLGEVAGCTRPLDQSDLALAQMLAR
ncbi:MAG: 6-phosphofructokinase, partial [Chloroflexota bacterium]